jgi:glycosyltransferase involved in cell wall biosynthesis
VGDLLEAVALLCRQGEKLRLTVVGDGPDLPRLRERAAAFPPETVHFTGRIGNEEAFQLMKRSTLVCVPSRHEFPEGFPLTLTEALASRTPVIASDHPVIVRAFADGQGVRFFRASDPPALAETVRAVLGNAETYGRLSELTAAAFAAVECPTTFGDLVARWQATI